MQCAADLLRPSCHPDELHPCRYFLPVLGVGLLLLALWLHKARLDASCRYLEGGLCLAAVAVLKLAASEGP